ncbi:MAG: response regulator transcription factor [Oscillatoriophycideae cyanobacterium NC_groundwater_1537_Pr4_S-0.65um_50_18]|nr:response regulator transcription factor [Oscillatoriophycideae cyanobacterium NC_groundwater_1537_Pr4_S-0.65um_50_18]
MIRVLLVDDQDIFRQGLAALLSIREDIEVVGQACNGQEAIAFAAERQPDVVLMDVRMPICDGLTATHEIHQRYPWIQIVVLTTFDDDEYIWQSLQSGAIGYLLKRTPTDQVVSTIRSAYLGYSQLSPTIASKVFNQLTSKQFSSEAIEQSQLSKRELEVLMLIGQGKNNQEIAEMLHLSDGTVRNYVTRILSQLNLRDRVQAVLWAQQHLTD